MDTTWPSSDMPWLNRFDREWLDELTAIGSADRRRRRPRSGRCARRRASPRAARPRGHGLRRRWLAGVRHSARSAAGARPRRRLAGRAHRRGADARRRVNATFAPQLAVVLSFHGVVERIEHPEIQVNHVELESFQRIVELVRSRYEVATLDDIAAAVRGEASLPANAAALTFDDAYRSVLELADPLLDGLPYAVFVPSGLIDSGSRVPTYVMRAALAFTEEPSVQLPGRSGRSSSALRTTGSAPPARRRSRPFAASGRGRRRAAAPAGAAARRAVGGDRCSVRQRGFAGLGRAALARRTRRRGRVAHPRPRSASRAARRGRDLGFRCGTRRRRSRTGSASRAVTSVTRMAIRPMSPGMPSKPLVARATAPPS